MMKKASRITIIAIVALVAASLLTSCLDTLVISEIPQEDLQEGAKAKVHHFSVGAQMPDFIKDDPEEDTKASGQPVIRLYWNEGDQVSVVNLTTGKILGGRLSASRGGVSTSFTGDVFGTISAEDKIALLYPAVGTQSEQEKTFSKATVDFSKQKYEDQPPVCVYSILTADGTENEFTRAEVKFDFLMAYMSFNLSSLPASTEISTLEVDDVASKLTLKINDDGDGFTTTTSGSKIYLNFESKRTNSFGTLHVAVTIPASEATEERRNIWAYFPEEGEWYGSNFSSAELYTGAYYSTIVSGFTVKNNPTGYDEGGIWSQLVRATTSTITVAWTTEARNRDVFADRLPVAISGAGTYYHESDASKTYNVSLYRDEACSDLVVSWSLPGTVLSEDSNDDSRKPIAFNENYPTRFTFSGLEPSTTYYVKIQVREGEEGSYTYSGMKKGRPVRTSDPIDERTIVTENAGEGDLLLCESFDNVLYGGDLTTFSAGYSLRNRSSINELYYASGENPFLADQGKNGLNAVWAVNATGEVGLFNTMKQLVGQHGLSNWAMIPNGDKNGVVCSRPGYLKIGANKQHGVLITPQLSAIPQGSYATVKVDFKAAPYGAQSDFSEAEKAIFVKVYNGGSVGSDYVFSGFASSGSNVGQKEELTLQGTRGEWNDYSVTLSGVSPTSRIGFGGNRSGSNNHSRFMIDDIKVEVLSIDSGTSPKYATGYVKYADNTPAVGVSVSDGFRTTVTDEHGFYYVTTSGSTRHISISYPADAAIVRKSNGMPDFYKDYSTSEHEYNFTLGAKISPEREFNIFAMADPQAHYEPRGDSKTAQKKADTQRFADEAVPALNERIANESVNCYGVTLGDIVYSEKSRDSSNGMTTMRDGFKSINMPTFQTMGNHDFTYFNAASPMSSSLSELEFHLKTQRKFESVFGPVNLSFNRGDAHIICMRNVVYTDKTDPGEYYGGFHAKQVRWLTDDLANVSKDKLIIFCVHIPLQSAVDNENNQAVINLLKQYPNKIILSGHTHYKRLITKGKTGADEHVHAALCGQWWWSKICGDGAPAGYTVYRIQGNQVINDIYYGINSGMKDGNYQMRVYRGNLKNGGSNAYFKWQHGSGTLLINVFNGSKKWTVEVSEDGGNTYNPASYMTQSKTTWNSITKGSTNKVPNESSQDWWSIGYHIGVLGRGMSSTSYFTANWHMFKYEMQNPSSTSIVVKATDTFGNTYYCTDVVTSGTSYPSMFKEDVTIK